MPETIEAAPPVRGKKVEWTSTGERQYYTQAEYKAAHRMVPYEQRTVAVPYKPDARGVGAEPPTSVEYGPRVRRRELSFRPHESAAGPRVTGLDRAVVPTGLSYEERERQGTEMVPFTAPQDRPVARAMTQPPAGVVVQPVQAVARSTEAYDALQRVQQVPKGPPKRLTRGPTQAQLADKDRDALFRRIAQAPQDIVGRVDAMHGLLGNERRHRAIAPRDRSPERTKARKRDRERERPGPVDRPMIK